MRQQWADLMFCNVPLCDTLGTCSNCLQSLVTVLRAGGDRDMPYPWLAAKENAYNDVSHDTVLHHGVSAFTNRAGAKPIDMRLTEMTPVGYTVRWVRMGELIMHGVRLQQHHYCLVEFGRLLVAFEQAASLWLVPTGDTTAAQILSETHPTTIAWACHDTEMDHRLCVSGCVCHAVLCCAGSEASGAFADITRFPSGARRESPRHAGMSARQG